MDLILLIQRMASTLDIKPTLWLSLILSSDNRHDDPPFKQL